MKLSIDLFEQSDVFLVALANTYAAEIDRWAREPFQNQGMYDSVMQELQMNYIMLADHLEAKHPLCWYTTPKSPTVDQPQFWDHDFDDVINSELER